jgi:uncharacterized protein
LITGASSGIGAAFARIFAQHGHELVLLARRQARLDAVADAIAARGGERPHVIAIDLRGDGAAARVAALLAARDVEPEIVVNNAGFGLVGSAAELDREAQLAMIDLDIRVLTDLSLRFIEPMARHRGGLLNVASLAGFLPGPGMAVYFACKAYVLSFTQSLHRELAPSGIKVTALCPGPIRTEFFARAGVAADKLPRVFMRSAERAAREGYEGFMKGDRSSFRARSTRSRPPRRDSFRAPCCVRWRRRSARICRCCLPSRPDRSAVEGPVGPAAGQGLAPRCGPVVAAIERRMG